MNLLYNECIGLIMKTLDSIEQLQNIIPIQRPSGIIHFSHLIGSDNAEDQLIGKAFQSYLLQQLQAAQQLQMEKSDLTEEYPYFWNNLWSLYPQLHSHPALLRDLVHLALVTRNKCEEACYYLYDELSQYPQLNCSVLRCTRGLKHFMKHYALVIEHFNEEQKESSVCWIVSPNNLVHYNFGTGVYSFHQNFCRLTDVIKTPTRQKAMEMLVWLEGGKPWEEMKPGIES